MAVNAEMTLASTRRSPVGQRNLLSQQKVRGATRTGAFGNEGRIGVMRSGCPPGLAIEWLKRRDTTCLPGTDNTTTRHALAQPKLLRESNARVFSHTANRSLVPCQLTLRVRVTASCRPNGLCIPLARTALLLAATLELPNLLCPRPAALDRAAFVPAWHAPVCAEATLDPSAPPGPPWLRAQHVSHMHARRCFKSRPGARLHLTGLLESLSKRHRETV
jgi:hypothetical protein